VRTVLTHRENGEKTIRDILLIPSSCLFASPNIGLAARTRRVDLVFARPSYEAASLAKGPFSAQPQRGRRCRRRWDKVRATPPTRSAFTNAWLKPVAGAFFKERRHIWCIGQPTTQASGRRPLQNDLGF